MRQTEKTALINGRVHTPSGIVDSLVFEAGRITETGILPEAGKLDSAKVIDLHGRTVLPGFCDSGVHLMRWAVSEEGKQPEGGRPFDGEHPSNEDLSYLLKSHASKLASLGITEVWSNDIALFGGDFRRAQNFFMEAAASDGLPFRLRCQLRFSSAESLADYLADGWRTGDGVPLCQVGAVTCGVRAEQEAVGDLALTAHLSGMQICLDAAGKEATDGALTLIEQLLERRNITSRHLIQMETADEGQIERMSAGKLRAGGMICPVAAVKEKRPWLEMMRRGIILSAASGTEDGIVSPMTGIQAAVIGSGEAAERQDALSVAEAISLYTWNAAWNGRNERRRGELGVGLDADMVVLDRDPFSVSPEELGGIEPVLTVCAGRITYDSGKLS